MDNRYEIAEQNGMSREFADWFFDNKKAGCGSAWFVMMAVMWEGWKGSTAMLQGADGNSPDCWVACSERMPERDVDVQVYCADKKEQMVGYMEHNEQDGYFRFASLPNGGGVYCQPTHWMPLPAAPQQDVKP
ncbi:hypothetical protein SedNR2807_13220 [Citrobacter sedlakii]